MKQRNEIIKNTMEIVRVLGNPFRLSPNFEFRNLQKYV